MNQLENLCKKLGFKQADLATYLGGENQKDRFFERTKGHLMFLFLVNNIILKFVAFFNSNQ